MPDEISKRLASLDAATRDRIQAKLLAQIDKELVSGAIGGQTNANFDRQHDRGPLFGKDFDRQTDSLEDIRAISNLDDEQFSKFTERLSQLRGDRG